MLQFRLNSKFTSWQLQVASTTSDLNLSVVSGPAPVAHRSDFLGGVLEKATVIPPGSRSNVDSPIPSLRYKIIKGV